MGNSKIKSHTVVATAVLIAAAAWIATGEFSFVGSDAAPKGGGASAATDARDETVPLQNDSPPVDPLQTVAYIVAEPGGHQRIIRLSGETTADKRVVLVARTTGAVAGLPAAEGDTLAEGDLVMVLDGQDRLAALASAEAQFELADHQAESEQALFEDGNLPRLRYEASVAAREAARSAVEMARTEVGHLELRAPFGGIVDRLSVEVGTWVQPGTEVATILSLDPVVVTAEIGERDLQWLAPGTTAEVTFGDGTTAQGVVRYIRREATAATRTFPIEVAVANPGGRIPGGMSADVTLAVPTGPAVLLQRSAITLDSDGTVGVRVLDAADTAGFLAVDLLDDTPEGLLIGGVPEGTRVVVSGQDMVIDGQRVAAVEAGTADAE